MLRNRRLKNPYILACVIIICIVALVVLEIKGIKPVEKTIYTPQAKLCERLEDSKTEYIRTERLQLTYQFSSAGYQTDIVNLTYQQMEHGIAAQIADTMWLYIGEYDREDRGINIALKELPLIFLKGRYNPNSTYANLEKTQEGYLSGLPVTYTYTEVVLATRDEETEEKIMAVYDFTADNRGFCIAVMAAGTTKEAKDNCQKQAEEIALTIRENPDYKSIAQRNEISHGKVDMEIQEKTEPVIEQIQITELTQEDGSVNDAEASGLKTQYVEPTPTPEPTPKPTPKPTAKPQPTKEPESEPVIEPPPVQAETPVVNTGDINEQAFSAPLTGVSMSVTVTLGNVGASTVTITCPDGTSLSPSSINGNTFTFYTTSQPGTYVVVTAGYKAAGSVSVHVHCG